MNDRAFGNELNRAVDDDLTRTIEESLRVQLATGVTTVRDLGDMGWSVLEWRRRHGGGLPTIVASGPPITSRGGHCWNMGGEASGVRELRAAVRERVERTEVDRAQFTAEELAAVVDEAHAAADPVAAQGARHGSSPAAGPQPVPDWSFTMRA
jgi:hypothetical protein